MSDFAIGDRAKWDWGNGTGDGTVKEKFTTKVTRTIKGSEVTRNATSKEPAYLLEQDDGDEVLKGASELREC